MKYTMVNYICHVIVTDEKGRFDHLTTGLTTGEIDRYHKDQKYLKDTLKKSLGHLFIQDYGRFKRLYELWEKVDPTFFEIIKETKEDIKERASRE